MQAIVELPEYLRTAESVLGEKERSERNELAKLVAVLRSHGMGLQ